MATFLTTMQFTEQGIKAVRDTCERAAAFKAAAKKMGVKVSGMYRTLGAFDGLIVFVLVLVADSFAGERERHTLETLLGTRLSDQVILLGKMTAAVLYAWAMFVITLAVAVLGINIMYGHGRLIMFPMSRLVPTLIYDFLLAVLLSCIGVFVSLRAPTVRQAMQTLNLGFMVTVWGSFFGFQSLPREWRIILLGALAGENLIRAEIVAGVVLIVADAALLMATRARFRRARLILD